MAADDLPAPPSIGPADMQVVERVLGMRTGYVLDFSDRTFDEFVAHEVGVDATAPRFSVDGGSKAKRLRRILPELSPGDQAKLLREFMRYRDSPARGSDLEVLDDEWRRSFEEVVARLEAMPRVEKAPDTADAPPVKGADARSSSWTGRRGVREQAAVVREVVPMASAELLVLIDLVEARRFNDPETAAAIEVLRELHAQLGELLRMVDGGSLAREAVVALERNRRRLLKLISEGAKVALVAPALTFGVVHLLSWIGGVPVDSTMLAGVYGTMVGAEALKAHGRRTGIED